MRNNIQHIGTLNGPLLIFGGVYSNLQALEQLISIAKAKKIPPSNIICTGDIVAYCAEPEACLQTIQDWGIHCITGNVELQLINNEDDCGCNFEESTRCDLFSKNWYPFAKSKVSATSLAWLQTLPEFIQFNYAEKECFVLHGSYQNTSEFIFKSTPWTVKAKQFQQLNVDVILAGHCGIPFHDNKNGQYWLNAGVIGMPANDGATSVWYLEFCDQQGFLSFEFNKFAYDHLKTAQLMEDNHLPQAYAHTLRTGIWDNCDILPSVETHQQGMPLFIKCPAKNNVS
ncbi:metallophosphoesterase [Aureispira sp. CCB-QB1]|uniref:metallophosphoesterase family protein n=1 Tax=Aureispira sp. CCB-QB1 TaxID=1313421 RepID=UPI000697F67F|nr:metallophosphoesterase family protein [Aureispira sp. CCB-QB1]